MYARFTTLLGRLFDWHGRASRTEFFLVWLTGGILTLVYLVPYFTYFWQLVQDSIDYGVDAAIEMMGADTMTWSVFIFITVWHWLSFVTLMAMSVIGYMTTVRRLADMGWSRWFIVVGAMPLLNFLFLLVLFFWPGRKKVAQEGAPGTDDSGSPQL
ncbi:DUF805 domain-containing protein [Sutterella sp.]|uniref:DUF805 domain-containing protein n=1 Tax=Sutterella sp. TaxID=1981025 RepID=UPI003FD864B6